ncbi:MAG TPA: hypothetical protein VFF64_19210 [Candidatus Eremiobacteraceae bacterium]|nr:hypothetical protein [Candidatus Eremiobacteraceae bacterium]
MGLRKSSQQHVGNREDEGTCQERGALIGHASQFPQLLLPTATSDMLFSGSRLSKPGARGGVENIPDAAGDGFDRQMRRNYAALVVVFSSDGATGLVSLDDNPPPLAPSLFFGRSGERNAQLPAIRTEQFFTLYSQSAFARNATLPGTKELLPHATSRQIGTPALRAEIARDSLGTESRNKTGRTVVRNPREESRFCQNQGIN